MPLNRLSSWPPKSTSARTWRSRSPSTAIRGRSRQARCGSHRSRRAGPHRRPGGQAGHDPEDPRGECNAVFDEYCRHEGRPGQRHSSHRFEGGAAIVTIGKTEALLPRSEQIPGETHHVGERIKAVILDVRKVGHRVKIILSRTHPDFVRRLFENEIPEIADRTIEIKAIAREAGYRAKIAVSSIDLKVDCVGACVGVRGSRIKNIVDELGGERIDIVRWNDSLQVHDPQRPAAGRRSRKCSSIRRLGRAIVLVKEDQLSLAIGRRGQNVRLASKLVGWDIEIMTHDELNEGIERAEQLVPADPERDRGDWSRPSSKKASCPTTT